MNKVKFVFLAAGLAFATALARPSGFVDEDYWDYEYDEEPDQEEPAQPSITSSLNGSVGYYRVMLNGWDWENYPFNGAGFAIGGSSLILITDIVRFGFLASIGYYSVSVSYEDNTSYKNNMEFAISRLFLDVKPKFRLGGEETYADIFLNIEIPLSTEMAIKVPGYETLDFDLENTEANFAVGFFWRFKVSGVGIGKTLTGNSKNTTIMAAFFIPVRTRSTRLWQKSATKIFEIIPSISYGTGKDGTSLNVSLGAEYAF